MGDFAGTQMHAPAYQRPDDFGGQRVVIVGGGNSAAQILIEASTVADTTWVTAQAAGVPARSPSDCEVSPATSPLAARQAPRRWTSRGCSSWDAPTGPGQPRSRCLVSAIARDTIAAITG